MKKRSIKRPDEPFNQLDEVKREDEQQIPAKLKNNRLTLVELLSNDRRAVGFGSTQLWLRNAIIGMVGQLIGGGEGGGGWEGRTRMRSKLPKVEEGGIG